MRSVPVILTVLTLFICENSLAKPQRLGFDCCQTVRVSGSSLMTNFQPSAIGLYKSTGGKINNRMVYRHQDSKIILFHRIKHHARALADYRYPWPKCQVFLDNF
jgi:hypothetical protein